MMKLREYAKKHGICYRTAWNRFHAGKIPSAYMDDSGHIFVPTNNLKPTLTNVAIYARVSNKRHNDKLEAQAKRLIEYATAKGYTIVEIVKETGNGVKDNRKHLIELLSQDNWGTLLVEHRDRLTRVGFNYLDALVIQMGKRIEVINMAEDNKDELIDDFAVMVNYFCSEIYGINRAKAQTEAILDRLIKS